MARNLTVGDQVRALGGTARVESIISTGVMPVFNLVVAENSDYFVGNHEILAYNDTIVQTVYAPFDASSGLAAIAPRTGTELRIPKGTTTNCQKGRR